MNFHTPAFFFLVFGVCLFSFPNVTSVHLSGPWSDYSSLIPSSDSFQSKATEMLSLVWIVYKMLGEAKLPRWNWASVCSDCDLQTQSKPVSTACRWALQHYLLSFLLLVLFNPAWENKKPNLFPALSETQPFIVLKPAAINTRVTSTSSDVSVC